MAKLDDKKLKKLRNAVITDLFYKKLTKKEVKFRYGITTRQYERILEMSLDSGKITPKQNKERIFRARGHSLKADKETVKKITYDVFVNHITKPEICREYHISKSVFTRAMNLSVDYGFISKEQMQRYRDASPIRGFDHAILNVGKKVLEEKKLQGFVPEGDIDLLIRRFGEEELQRRLYAGRDKWIGLNMGDFKDNSKEGGKATQKKHGEKVQKNLKNAKYYGKNQCYYEEIEFHSEGERFTGLLLVELGLIPEIIVKENFHRYINGKIEVDFYINDKLIVEYHPQVKKHKNIESLTDDEYIKKRVDQISETFKGTIINLSKANSFEYYTKLGLSSKMAFSEFLVKYHAVEEKIEKHDKEIAELEKFFDEKIETHKSLQKDELPF